MKKKLLAPWTPWEDEEDARSRVDIAQAAAIRVTFVTTPTEAGGSPAEVFELEGLRWGFDLTVVPGPEETQ